MLNEKMYNLGAKSSVIREIFEYGKKRKAEIGEENVYDFSLGNPSVPSPDEVNNTLIKLISEKDPTLPDDSKRVILKEDESDPKWLFHVTDLELVI